METGSSKAYIKLDRWLIISSILVAVNVAFFVSIINHLGADINDALLFNAACVVCFTLLHFTVYPRTQTAKYFHLTPYISLILVVSALALAITPVYFLFSKANELVFQALSTVTLLGSLLQIRKVSQDQKKHQENQLTGSEFLSFFEMTSSASVIISCDSQHIEHANSAFLNNYLNKEYLDDTCFFEDFFYDGTAGINIPSLLRDGNKSVRNYDITFKVDNKWFKKALLSAEHINFNDKACYLITLSDPSTHSAPEQNIKEISERLLIATQTSSIGIWELNLQTNEIVWDDTMFQLYGMQKIPFNEVRLAWGKTIHLEDIERVSNDFKKAISGEKKFNTEYRIVWPDASIRYLRVSALVQCDEHNVPFKMIGTNYDITREKNVEAELILSNLRNRIFVEQAPRAMAMLDTSMHYMAASQQWIEDYNLHGVEIIGRSHYDIFPEISEDWKKIHSDCLKGAVNKCDESPFSRADGTLQWLTWDIRPWYSSPGVIGGLIMYTANITETKEKDLEKLRIEEILDKTNEVARIGTWEVDLPTRKITWSRITKEIHEVPIDFEPTLDTALNFYKPGQNRTLIMEAVKNAMATGTSYDIEVELMTSTGKALWARTIGQVEFRDGKCHKLFGVFQDIDRLKRSEQLLHKANEELKAIFNIGPISIIGTDQNGIITHFNRGAETMLQYSNEEMLGKQTPATIHLRSEVEKRGQELSQKFNKTIQGFDVFVEMTKQGKDETREWTYVRKDGSQLSVLLTVTALKNEHNEIVNFLGMAVDISERTENQRKLLEAKQDLELLTEKLTSQNVQLANFAHITSHNLRSPVSNLDALLQLHKESSDLEERAELFDKFEIVINHLSSTLNSLIEAIKIRELSVKDQCENNFQSILEKTKQLVSAQLMESNALIESDFNTVPTIEYNPHYLESIFLNLLTNAVKYKSPSRKPHIRFSTSKQEGRVILKVEDNGLGIDLKRHGNKLFGLHKTFHRHPEARGVGLYLTKTQVEAMGGSIQAKSEPGIGTIFNVRF